MHILLVRHVNPIERHSLKPNGGILAQQKKDRLTVLIDGDLKAEAMETFKAMGLTLTAGIEVYLRAVVREKQIPFAVAAIDSVDSDNERVN